MEAEREAIYLNENGASGVLEFRDGNFERAVFCGEKKNVLKLLKNIVNGGIING